ncbi:MAG TPA: alpha/beta hydrolase [Pyrinomonadaceae bacterium]|nr:alpha/beta hydrolase [Pyrinomonadaceae bacterium]
MKKRYWFAGGFALAGVALAAHRLSRPLTLDWREHAAGLHHPDRSRFADVGGVRLHYQEAGDANAPAVVLIHGFLVSNFVWRDVLLPLAERGLRVVAPDLVGFGFSGKPADGEYTIEAQARAIIGLLDELGIERATLVGSSYGAAVAAVCALDWPGRVGRLVLVGAVCNDELKRHPVLRLVALRGLGELLAPPLLDARYVIRRKLGRRAAKNGDALAEERRIAGRHLPLRASDAQRAVISTVRGWSAGRVEREAERISQPTLLVWGEGDADTPPRHGETLRRLIPDSRLLTIERCGHLPQEECPQLFVETVAAFCRGERVAGAI